MKLRIKFSKNGVMRFIGHLDIMRYFQKAIRRAEIDIAYTGGFNPHQIMSFAAPLGVGLTSNGEYMDIEVNSVTTSMEMMEQINNVMVPGIKILNIIKLNDDAKNAMASVAAAEYTVRFRDGYEPSWNWEKQILSFYEQPSIFVVKKTKKSEIELDLKPFIFSLDLITDSAGNKAVRMVVDASSSGNIKPSLVMEAFMKANQQELAEFSLEITREDTFTNIGEDNKLELIPLDKAGSDF